MWATQKVANVVCFYNQIRHGHINIVLISFTACTAPHTYASSLQKAAHNSCQHGNAGGRIYTNYSMGPRQFTSAEGVLWRRAGSGLASPARHGRAGPGRAGRLNK